MTNTVNSRLRGGKDSARAVATPPAVRIRRGPATPQPGVPVPDLVDRLPRRDTADSATVWWLGVHGGAGESTLAALATGTRAASHAWPLSTVTEVRNRVVLVARTNYAGLVAAQRAATEWASDTLNGRVDLAGLVLMADAPGRLPKELRDLEQVVAGGVPRTWVLPWVNGWRFAPPTTADTLPREFRQLFADISLTLQAFPLTH